MEEASGDQAKLAVPESELRVSPQERELAVTRLQDAYVSGYLNEAELDARIRKALDAKFRSELSALVGDLPSRRRSPRPSGCGRSKS